MEIQNMNEFMYYFSRIHQRTLRVINTIPEDKYFWKPSKTSFSCAELIIHIANINRQMYGETIQGKQSGYQGHSVEIGAATPAQIKKYFRESFTQVNEILESIKNEELNDKIQTPAGVEIRIWKWLRAMVEHEVHHRGQIYYNLRMQGIETPPLYGLTSEEVRDLSV